jgi:hypothetical protein
MAASQRGIHGRLRGCYVGDVIVDALALSRSAKPERFILGEGGRPLHELPTRGLQEA